MRDVCLLFVLRWFADPASSDVIIADPSSLIAVDGGDDIIIMDDIGDGLSAPTGAVGDDGFDSTVKGATEDALGDNSLVRDLDAGDGRCCCCCIEVTCDDACARGDRRYPAGVAIPQSFKSRLT